MFAVRPFPRLAWSISMVETKLGSVSGLSDQCLHSLVVQERRSTLEQSL